MKLTFLGTGPSMPIPRIGCQCRTCKDARRPKSKSARLRSSVLLTYRGRHILFDAGPDISQQLEKAKTFCVDAIFLTHAHFDACGGLSDLDKFLRGQKHKATLYAEQGTWSRVKNNLGKAKPWLFVRIITPGRKIKIFGLTIIPFRVLHSATAGFPTLGYRVGNNFVYASDIKKIPKESEKFIKNIPRAVLDGCMWFGRQIPTHLNVEQSIRIAERLNVKNLYLTQISHKYPPHNEASRAIQDYCKKEKIRPKVTLAYDGLEIKI